MTLRLRVLSALLAVAMIVVTAFGLVVARQRAVLTNQLDEQLLSVEQNLSRVDQLFETVTLSAASGGAGPPTGELYIAVHNSSGRIEQAARPATAPTFAPKINLEVLGSRQPPYEPFTVDAVGGGGARVLVRDLGDGRWAVAALPTNAVENAQRDLLLTAAAVLIAVLVALGLVMFWVDRLGIKPIVEVARAAEELADATSEARVEPRSHHTEAGRLGRSFNKMLDARQAANDQQRRFVADASHELRTPLTTIQGYAALHARGDLATPEAVDDAMQRIGAEVKRMTALVAKLLTLASLDEGRSLSTSGIDLSQLLHDLATDASVIQPNRAITQAIDSSLRITGDVELLTQAFTAAVHNALRHTATSSGLTIRGTLDPPNVCVEIADDGPGIEPEHLEHIFDRFYRSDAGRTRKNGGAGLGLAIAKAVTEAHAGTISIKSSRGGGTTIVYELPIDGPQEVSSKP